MEKMVLPLSNGVGLQSADKLCVSIIDYNGNKKVGGRVVKSHKKFWDAPVVRGFTYFFKGIYLYICAFFLEQSFDEKETKQVKTTGKINFASSYIMLITSFLVAFLFGFLALGLLPSFLFDKAFGYSSYYFKSFMVALIRVAIVYIMLVLLRFLPFMSGLYHFNGAGNNYMSGKDGSLRARTYPLNFLNFLVNVFIFSLFVVSLIAVNINFIANFFINLAIFLVCIPLIYEVLRFLTGTKYLWLKDITILTNFLVYIKPNTTHVEVLMTAELELNSYNDFEKMDKDRYSMSALYAEMGTKLKAGERFDQSDVDWIVATVLGKNRAEIKLVRSVSQKEYREIMRACERRAKGEPLSSIFGFVEFYGLRLDVNKKVLSPRMETELLVDEALKKIREYDLKTALDMCTGSGAIAIALDKYSSCKVSGVDISKQALQVAEANASKNQANVDFIQSDLFKGLKKNRKYDIIISNPPYIKSGDIEKLDIEVKKYDPRLALDGGEDGLDFYREIVEGAPRHLNKKGWLFFEVGAGQAGKVQELMEGNGFDCLTTIKDYNKIERIVYGRIGK